MSGYRPGSFRQALVTAYRADAAALNDQLVVDKVVMENYWERDQPIYATGPIELQNHGTVLWFKNIYVRELP